MCWDRIFFNQILGAFADLESIFGQGLHMIFTLEVENWLVIVSYSEVSQQRMWDEVDEKRSFMHNITNVEEGTGLGK